MSDWLYREPPEAAAIKDWLKSIEDKHAMTRTPHSQADEEPSIAPPRKTMLNGSYEEAMRQKREVEAERDKWRELVFEAMPRLAARADIYWYEQWHAKVKKLDGA